MKQLILVLLLAPVLSLAQTSWDSVEIKTTKITDQISYLEGRGGNIGVFHGKDGILIVDDQYEQLSNKIMNAIKKVSHEEFKYIVNSHYHGDHIGSNAALSAYGPSIIAHENVRVRLGKTFYSNIWDRDIEAKPEAFWPDNTFNDQVNLYVNGETIQLIHTPNAHTDGDILIFFKSNNVIHSGDAFVRYGYPFIDVPAGGSIDGLIAAQKRILEMADENTKIIPGHGQISSITDVQELLDMLTATRKIIYDLKTDGENLDDCIGANPFADFHDRWSGSFIDSDLFVRLIYESLD
jgi:glyoxylase-like metal-dependent hydrolase (beta-lactamase superfamily II)